MNITLFYENVTVLDYAFHCYHKGLVGNSYKVHVEFIGHTDHEGILYDFSYAKKKVKEIIDRDCDHRFVVPTGITKFEGNKAYTQFKFGVEALKVEYWCPSEGICEIPFKHVSKETLTTYLETIIQKEMPKTVDAVKITLEDEYQADHSFYFHYTHGLKDHYGNCQRLFHGHRNTVKISVNGERRKELEEYLARDLFSGCIHYVYWENVKNKSELSKVCGMELPEGRFENLSAIELEYQSSQGAFRAILPGSICYIMQTETTVENLSQHFAKVVKNMLNQNDQVVAVAYEGIAKGAKTTL